MDQLSKVLTTKFRNERLAHLYQIVPPFLPNITKDDVSTWTIGLIEDWLEVPHRSLLSKGHDDFLMISPSKAQYVVDDFEDLFRFQQYKPIQANYRVTLIEEAHLITSTVANKLLKVLEEPQDNHVIILMNPLNKSLLQTIESRSITLRIPLEEKITSSQFTPELEEIVSKETTDQSIWQAIDTIKKSKEREQELVDLLAKRAVQSGSYLKCQEFLKRYELYLREKSLNISQDIRIANLLK